MLLTEQILLPFEEVANKQIPKKVIDRIIERIPATGIYHINNRLEVNGYQYVYIRKPDMGDFPISTSEHISIKVRQLLETSRYNAVEELTIEKGTHTYLSVALLEFVKKKVLKIGG